MNFGLQHRNIVGVQLLQHRRYNGGSVSASFCKDAWLNAAADYNASLEKAVCCRNLAEISHLHSAAGLTEDRDIVRISAEGSNISMIFYDVTGKPPATVEWE